MWIHCYFYSIWLQNVCRVLMLMLKLEKKCKQVMRLRAIVCLNGGICVSHSIAVM